MIGMVTLGYSFVSRQRRVKTYQILGPDKKEMSIARSATFHYRHESDTLLPPTNVNAPTIAAIKTLFAN
jgi:hypothetical protein